MGYVCDTVDYSKMISILFKPSFLGGFYHPRHTTIEPLSGKGHVLFANVGKGHVRFGATTPTNVGKGHVLFRATTKGPRAATNQQQPTNGLTFLPSLIDLS